MSNLTVVILTKNEEYNIADAVKSAFKVANKVVVVDSGSTDKTVELAKSNGAYVIYHDLNNDFAAQRNFADKCVDTEWVLHLDADERIEEELVASIKTVLAENKSVMCELIRRNHAFGKIFKYGVLAPSDAYRMYPVGKACWQDMVHEWAVSDLPIITLKGYLTHFVYVDFAQYLNKMNMYSSISAMNNKAKGKKVSVVRDIVFRPIFAFFKMYILKGGFLDGWLGFVLSLNHANYTLNKYVKLKLLR